MIFKGLIDQNYRILNKVISRTNIEPSPEKVSFTIDGNTEDKTKLDFYETSSIISVQDNPKAKAKKILIVIIKLIVQLRMQILMQA